MEDNISDISLNITEEENETDTNCTPGSTVIKTYQDSFIDSRYQESSEEMYMRTFRNFLRGSTIHAVCKICVCSNNGESEICFDRKMNRNECSRLRLIHENMKRSSYRQSHQKSLANYI